jgi:Tol biopolymer transport system component
VESLTEVEAAGAGWNDHGFAVSPDGRRIAFKVYSADTATGGIEIVTLGEERHRAYWPGTTGTDLDGELSWSADGRYLAFELRTPGGGERSPNGLWILDTRLDGSDLVANSRRIGLVSGGSAFVLRPLLGAGGDRLYVVMAELRPESSGSTRILARRLVELDVATGRELRVLLALSDEFAQTESDGFITALSRDPSGKLLMVNVGGTDIYTIDLATGSHDHLTLPEGRPLYIAW